MKTNLKNSWLIVPALLMLAIVIAIAPGCQTPMRGKTAEQSGFLGDYSKLQPGQSGQAQLVYINPQANFAKYTKIMIDPISLMGSEDSKLANLPKEDVDALLSYLDGKLREELSKDYAIVNTAGPDVMKLRVALTEAKGARVVLNTISSVLPIGIAISVLKLAATGTHTSVGEVNVEAEILDAQTGQQLLAAMDTRAGRKVIVTGNFTKWGDVQDAFDYWAMRTRVRLEELSGKKVNP